MQDRKVLTDPGELSPQKTPQEKPKKKRRSEQPPVAVIDGLKWLVPQQNADGSWGAEGLSVKATAMTLLALLGDGGTHRSGPFKKNIRSGFLWLKSKQLPDGSFSTEESESAVATLAFCEIYRLTRSAAFRSLAQKGSEHLAGRFELKLKERLRANLQAEFYGWSIMAMGSAIKSKLIEDKGRLKSASVKFDAAMDTETGRIKDDKSLSLTSIGLISLMHHAEDSKNRDLAKSRATVLLGKNLPAWNKKVDPVSILFGSMAAYNTGGELWLRWGEAMKTKVFTGQTRQGAEKGAWPRPVGEPDSRASVSDTALMVLSAELHYRYGRVIGK